MTNYFQNNSNFETIRKIFKNEKSNIRNNRVTGSPN